MEKSIKKVDNNKKNKKNIVRKCNSKKNDKLIGIKEYNKENILIILLLVIFLVWGMILIIRYFDYKDINGKIDSIDELEGNIKLLNDGYVDIENGVKKIGDITDKNNKLDTDINDITNDIDELNSKISKYSK